MTYKKSGLTIDSNTSATLCEIIFEGKNRLENPEEDIVPFCKSCLSNYKGEHVRLDFSRMTFMNSGAIMVIFRLCRDFTRENYQISIAYDKTVKWQQNSFEYIQTVLKSYKNIVFE